MMQVAPDGDYGGRLNAEMIDNLIGKKKKGQKIRTNISEDARMATKRVKRRLRSFLMRREATVRCRDAPSGVAADEKGGRGRMPANTWSERNTPALFAVIRPVLPRSKNSSTVSRETKHAPII